MIPRREELVGKKYYKWHHSWSHNTVDCIVLRKNIQETIRQGNIRFTDHKEKAPIEVDVDLFLVMIGMVSLKSKGKMTQSHLCAQCKEEINYRPKGRHFLTEVFSQEKPFWDRFIHQNYNRMAGYWNRPQIAQNVDKCWNQNRNTQVINNSRQHPMKWKSFK